MSLCKLDEVLKATQGKLISQCKTSFSSISIDTRTLKPGSLYICIAGKNHDGHKFIGQAVKKGASGILISNIKFRISKQTPKITIIKVKDTLKALQDLAAFHRAKFNIPVIGITGSCGKTTTKDMIASILSKKMATHKNKENFNNEIGVPLTLLALKPKHKACVVEMGMQGLGEIELLAKIVKPTIAVITNIGEAHLLQMKHKKNIAKAKSEILKFLKPKDAAILPADDEYFKYLVARLRRAQSSRVKGQGARGITFGIYKKADVMPKNLAGIKLPIPGYHSVYNALSAMAVAKVLGIENAKIKKGLENFETSSNRMKIIEKNGVTIINDAYNANPTSMRAALNTLAQWDTERSRSVQKIAILGDMLELGEHSKKAHFKIGQLVGKLKIDILISIGKESQQIFAGAKKAGLQGNYHYKDKNPAQKKLQKLLSPGTVVLIKASRGMKLEEIIPKLYYAKA